MKVDFWFDPACPWCWLTSRWMLRVAPERDLDVTWHPISLFFKNDYEPGHRLYDATLRSRHLLRVVEAVREAGHADAIEGLYTRLGTHIHHDEQLDFEVADDLEALGLDRALADALEEERFDEAVRASMEAGLALTGQNVGTPIISFDNTDGERVALFGPVISRVPPDEQAVAAWDAFVTLARTPGFWETKRDRTEDPTMSSVPDSVKA
ncbi:MAG: DsbA family protein [Microthrixaceae bacterium]